MRKIIIPIPNNGVRMLDFGCGDGGFDEILPDRISCGSWLSLYGGTNAYGIDSDPKEIAKARKNIVNGTQFMIMDGNKLPFADSYFGVVHEFGVFHHMPNYKTAIAELARVTETAGIIHLTEAVDNYIPFRIARRVQGNWQGHKITSFFTSSQLINELCKYFEIEIVKYCWRPVGADFLRMFGLEPHVSLKLTNSVSQYLQYNGQGEMFACHVYIMGVRKC